MKRTRKIITLALALLMLLSLAAPAFAATVTNETGHDYKAYQIFSGTQKEGSSELADIAWGNGVNSAALLAALKASNTFASLFPEVEEGAETVNPTAAQVADFLDNSNAKEFAELVYNCIAGNGTPIGATEASVDLATGYYLIVDQVESDELEDDDVPNAALLQVTNDIAITQKNDAPEVDKNIKDDGKVNDASIGDTITYEIVGTMPTNIADYNTYYYVFHDTMSEGLTYKEGSMKVTVNGEDVTSYFYKNVVVADDGKTEITVGIQDLLTLDNDTNVDPDVAEYLMDPITSQTTVVLTYDAILNEDAKIGSANTNEVYLEYSNNPNVDGAGNTNPPDDTPDEPNPGEDVVTGNTPKSDVETYTTELTIKKVDENGEVLTGAAFKLTGEGCNWVITTGEVFVAYDAETTNETVEKSDDAIVKYWKLKDGTYTTTAPVADTQDKYDGTTEYMKVTEVTLEATGGNAVNVEAFVDANGLVTFTGLGAGQYTIEETVTPAGYNSIDNIVFEISFSYDEEDGAVFTSSNNTIVPNGEGGFYTEIENQSGSTLPETGGIGTTLFYVFGGIMVAGAAILLVTKKRMGTI